MKKILIIDGNALAHRGFHALPELTAPDGRLVNAVYGFFSAFLKATSDINPNYVCVCFDRPEPTFRHKKFKDYKAQRPKMPDDLISQMSLLKKTLEVMGVPIFEQAGYEADDLICTIAGKIQMTNDRCAIEVIILTGDLDLLQLVNQDTKVYILNRGIKEGSLYDEHKVRERYGLSPALLADYRGLKGDASDNIPGVPGIGPKTATKLLQEFGTLENIYEKLKIANCKLKIGARAKDLLREHKEQAFLSRDLARMRKDAPIEFNTNHCCLKNYHKEKAENVFKELGFKTLISRLPGNRRKQRSLI